MKKLLLALACLVWTGLAQAGTGYYVTFINSQDEPVRITRISYTKWYPEEFDIKNYVLPNESVTLYTENAEEPGLISLEVTGKKYRQQRIEIWQNGYPHSVTQNVSEYTLEASAGWVPPGDDGERFGIGTTDPSIGTAITARGDGYYGTVHAVVMLD